MKKVSIKNKRVIKFIIIAALSVLTIIALAFATKGIVGNEKAVYAESAPQMSF